MIARALRFAAMTVVILPLCAASLRAAGPAAPAANPDFTKGDRVPDKATHDWNLGPTGLRGWMYSNGMETSEARQVYVTQVEKGSPADGVFRQGDVILGVAGRPFAFDPRTELGKAIGAAEAADGKLSLIRWRDGKSATAVVQLRVLGAYGPMAPFECPKSKRVFEAGCEALARKMKENPRAGNPIVRSLNALALLASGKPEYLPLVREQVEWAAKYSDPQRRDLHCWFYGPINILLAEYTLATGDRSFAADLERITMEIVRGQSVVGSWGHRFIESNGRLGGYGMMNAPGVPLTVSLILARKAGVNDPALDKAIEKSVRLLRFYVGKGSIPYGDHAPWIEAHDDNGKNGIAAVMFRLLGDREAAEYFSRMSLASHGSERDQGHTGNFFNMLWAMPGVAVSGRHATGAWMNEFGWYYDLARRWDGTFLHQGPPQSAPDAYNGWDSTGAYLLAFAQPMRRIYLTGKGESVPPLEAQAAKAIVADGRGWSYRLRQTAYANRRDDEIFAGLRSWSPVVRERSAAELARRKGDPLPRLIPMLDESSLYARLGACQAMIMLKEKAAPAIPSLRKTLRAEDLWLRIKAAEAIAAIGAPAMSELPTLLRMLSEPPTKADPRNMQQRYLCFALFERRTGMLRNSLEGVDRQLLYEAVRAGLHNEDGRARGTIGNVYRNLSFEEIKPLLPAIHRAVIEPAPSGIMFADGIRLSGLSVLAKYQIEEGMSLCLEIMEIDRWGKKQRINECLKALQAYGAAARPLLPRLIELEKQLAVHPEAKTLQAEIELVRTTIDTIRNDQQPRSLRSLNDLVEKATK